MALPSSGQISLSDIYAEINGSHSTQQCSLRSLSSSASKTTPDAISEFHGYSAGSDITLNFASSTTYLVNTFSNQDGYRAVNITGMQTGDQIDINYTVFVEISGNANAACYYRKNSGGWVQQGYSTNSTTFAGIAYNVVPSDTVDIRIDAEISGFGDSCSLEAVLYGGTFDSGSGTISVGPASGFLVAVSS